MYVTAEKDRGKDPSFTDRITAALGSKREHIKRNFVPWALSCLACDQALQLCETSKRLRTRHLRAVCRELQSNATYYMNHEGGMSYRESQESKPVLELYDMKTGTDQWLAEIAARDCGANAEDCQNSDIAKHATLAWALLMRAEAIDRETDEILRRKVDSRICRRKDTALVRLIAALESLRPMGYRPPASKQMLAWVKVLENKAVLLIDDIISDMPGYD